MMATQEQGLRTNAMEAKVEKNNNNQCHLCKKADETVYRLLSFCKRIAQKDYKQRHGKVVAIIYWSTCKKITATCTQKLVEPQN